ncbi:MAG: Archaeal TRASH domain protein [candidate division BRC1 bacterium ADurb.BinA364]|nr:MAG: Archaeal TRASH domain protein [candidate division BRC1 bacterium ADurb.BinA364]
MRMNRSKKPCVLVVCFAFLWLKTGMAQAAESVAGDVYMLDFCPVTGEKLGSMGDPVVYKHDGRDIRFCCAACEPKFKEDPAKYLKTIDAKIVELQKPWYPLETCIVSGEKLGAMGDPIDYVYKNRLVRFCCEGCIAKFEAGAAEYLKKLDEAVIAKQLAAYPLQMCLVMEDKKITDRSGPVDFVLGNRLYRFCCNTCVRNFKANPQKYISKLDEALKKK